jgi:integrase
VPDRDNLHISRPYERWTDAPPITVHAINCTTLAERVEAFVRDSLAASTRRAYRSDLEAFMTWGGTIPASPETVAAYIASHANLLAIATLQRRLASISKAHASFRLPNPVSAELVRATMRGIRRANTRPRQEARPLLKDDLFLVLDAMGASTKDVRDRALLLIGFAGGFRRSELVGLDVTDIASVRQGVVITLRRSKTDQLGIGRQIGIPFGRTRHCPVRAFEKWLALSSIEAGPIFRPVSQSGLIAVERLSAEAVSLVLKERVAAASIDPAGYSGHSLRAGFVTSAVMAGASTWKVRAQTGHASDAMLSRYIRQAELFEDNACGAIL